MCVITLMSLNPDVCNNPDVSRPPLDVPNPFPGSWSALLKQFRAGLGVDK